MKKILKIALFTLLAVIVVALAGLHIAYISFSPNDKGVEVKEDNLVYFQESYDACRQAFLEEAGKVKNKYDQAELFPVRIPSQVDQDLIIDILYLPPLDSSDRLLILSSGIHGIEGFTGSAVQQMSLEELINEDVLSGMGVLMIHGINPFGFKYHRRCTENNVDLNRNSGTDPSLFETRNPGYGALYDMLNPEGPASLSSMRNQFFYLVAISKMLKESMSVLRQAVLQGQYEYPEGVYFGGMNFEPQIDSLARILPEYLSEYRTILAIDLHTGYGFRRVLHLFPNPVEDLSLKAKTEAVFEGHRIDWGDSDDFYTILGGFADSFLGGINPEATYLYMVFEWGTYDTQKTFGSLKALQTIINENQGFHYGYKNARQQEKIERRMFEAYYPDSDAWRSEVMESGRNMLKEALVNYGSMER
jgi:hypothetical protein